MAKYQIRFYAMVETVMEAENIDDAMNLCDLNVIDINSLAHQITEIDDVVEIEEL